TQPARFVVRCHIQRTHCLCALFIPHGTLLGTADPAQIFRRSASHAIPCSKLHTTAERFSVAYKPTPAKRGQQGAGVPGRPDFTAGSARLMHFDSAAAADGVPNLAGL